MNNSKISILLYGRRSSEKLVVWSAFSLSFCLQVVARESDICFVVYSTFWRHGFKQFFKERSKYVPNLQQIEKNYSQRRWWFLTRRGTWTSRTSTLTSVLLHLERETTIILILQDGIVSTIIIEIKPCYPNMLVWRRSEGQVTLWWHFVLLSSSTILPKYIDPSNRNNKVYLLPRMMCLHFAPYPHGNYFHLMLLHSLRTTTMALQAPGRAGRCDHLLRSLNIRIL